MIRLEVCQRKQQWEERGERERRGKKKGRDVFAFAINVTLIVFESSVPHFLCPFF